MKALIAILLLLPTLAMAQAGRVLFADGVVEVRRGERMAPIRAGHTVRAGDVITTGSESRVHMRMNDRSLISLRPNSEFVIDEFEYSAGRDTGAERSTPGRSVFSLFRGAMRAITGAIARNDRASFEVRTLVATIGVRGTTFDVACINACEEGAVFGVLDGSIVVTTEAGSVILERNEYGFARSRRQPPVRLIGSPLALRDDLTRARRLSDEERERRASRAADERDDADKSVYSGSDSGDTRDQNQPPPDGNESTVTEATENPLRNTRRDLAYSFGPYAAEEDGFSQQIAARSTEFRVNDRGELIQFPGLLPASDGGFEVVRYGIEDDSDRAADQSDNSQSQIPGKGTETTAPPEPRSAVNVESGRDPQSGIRWGRWSGGDVTATNSGGTQTLDFSRASLHWIISAFRDAQPMLPATGTRAFELYGNTDPTDNFGNRGVLGNATLSANFDAQSVASSLSLFIDDQNWSAFGNGDLGSALSAETPDHIFSGIYDTVDVDGTAGSGSFSGFITDEAEAAGLSYVLSQPTEAGSQVVSGTAAFRAVEGVQQSPGGISDQTESRR